MPRFKIKTVKYYALIITNVPNYYKLNLFNAISANCRLYIIFIAAGQNLRNKDFSRLNGNTNFDFTILNDNIERRNRFLSCIRLFKLLRNIPFRKFVLGEWGAVEYWFSLFLVRKLKFMILELNVEGVSLSILKNFLNQISRALPVEKSILNYLII